MTMELWRQATDDEYGEIDVIRGTLWLRALQAEANAALGAVARSNG
jgi:hypothetical protein